MIAQVLTRPSSLERSSSSGSDLLRDCEPATNDVSAGLSQGATLSAAWNWFSRTRLEMRLALSTPVTFFTCTNV
jgi:hypothetical protein